MRAALLCNRAPVTMRRAASCMHAGVGADISWALNNVFPVWYAGGQFASTCCNMVLGQYTRNIPGYFLIYVGGVVQDDEVA